MKIHLSASTPSFACCFYVQEEKKIFAFIFLRRVIDFSFRLCLDDDSEECESSFCFGQVYTYIYTYFLSPESILFYSVCPVVIFIGLYVLLVQVGVLSEVFIIFFKYFFLKIHCIRQDVQLYIRTLEQERILFVRIYLGFEYCSPFFSYACIVNDFGIVFRLLQPNA